MAKKIDPLLIEILTKYGERPEDALWDCHGTWVAYHKAIERIAAKAGVVFDMPQIIEANSAEKTVAIAVAGRMGDRSEWSFGEASPANNKNGYPYAMAEKRAKDRVVLKLIGLHGLVLSEEESDDFKDQPTTAPPVPAPSKKDARPVFQKLIEDMRQVKSKDDLRRWFVDADVKALRAQIPADWDAKLKTEMADYAASLVDDTFPGDRPSNFTHPIMAG